MTVQSTKISFQSQKSEGKEQSVLLVQDFLKKDLNNLLLLHLEYAY